MFKSLRLVVATSLVVVVALMVLSPAAQASHTDSNEKVTLADTGNAYCVGKDLVVEITMTNSGAATNEYRVNGTGPNLPSTVTGPFGSIPVSLTYTIPGPGTWSDLIFEWQRLGDGITWTESGTHDVSPTSITCDSSEPATPIPTAKPVVPRPGPDMVFIPDTAVVGAFVMDTVVYFAPQADAATDIVIEAGKTMWVYGVDASGDYYKVMLSGKFFWVPVETMGPNYDEVWNGWPLPTDVVE